MNVLIIVDSNYTCQCHLHNARGHFTQWENTSPVTLLHDQDLQPNSDTCMAGIMEPRGT